MKKKKTSDTSEISGRQIFLKGGVEYGESEGVKKTIKGIFRDFIFPLVVGFFVLVFGVSLGFAIFQIEVVRVVFVMGAVSFLIGLMSWMIGHILLKK